MKTWLKYGLIGAGISLVFILLNIIIPDKVIDSSAFIENLIFFPQIVGFLFASVFNLINFAENAEFPYLFIGIVNFIFYFLIGALIGLIVGKIKSKKEVGIQKTLKSPNL